LLRDTFGSLLRISTENLLKGGILNLQRENIPFGKLRLLYEANALAFIQNIQEQWQTDGNIRIP